MTIDQFVTKLIARIIVISVVIGVLTAWELFAYSMYGWWGVLNTIIIVIIGWVFVWACYNL